MDRLRPRHRRREHAAGGGRLTLRLAAAAACFLLVLLLGWAVQHGRATAFDETVMRALYAPGAAPVWRAASRLGDSAVRLTIMSAAILLLLRRRGVATAAWFAGLVFGGMALNGVAKEVASRVRPGLLPHLEHVEGFSFPSGHAAGVTVLALGLALLFPAVWRRAALSAAVALLLLVGLSRIALGVHWPSDVLAGWIEGLGWVLLVRTIAGARR